MRPDYDRGLVLRTGPIAILSAREQVALRLGGTGDQAGSGDEVGAVRDVQMWGPRSGRVFPQQLLNVILPDACCDPFQALHVLVRRAGLVSCEQKRFASALRLGEKDRVRDGLAHRQRSTVGCAV
jgi:hypothetical protein